MGKFQMYKDSNIQWRWRFRADNNQIVAASAEGYVNKQDCRNGIDILKKQTSNADVEETG